MICDIVTPDGKPYEGDPRYVLRRALERMASPRLRHVQRRSRARYFLFRDDKGTETLDEGGYFAHDHARRREASCVRRPLRALEGMGIPMSTCTTRSARRSTRSTCASRTARDGRPSVTYRLIVKEITKEYRYHATFMPKPIFGENGSGMHLHQSLFNEGRDAFFDGDDEWNLSAVGKAFIAGRLGRRESSARCSPSG